MSEDPVAARLATLERVIDGLALGEHFEFHVVSCASVDQVEYARARLSEALGGQAVDAEVAVTDLGRPRELLKRLLDRDRTPRGVLVLSATVMETQTDRWALVFQRLNEARNYIMTRFDGLVLLVLPPLKSVFAHNAQDFFSWRSSSVVLEPPEGPPEGWDAALADEERLDDGYEEVESSVSGRAVVLGTRPLDGALTRGSPEPEPEFGDSGGARSSLEAHDDASSSMIRLIDLEGDVPKSSRARSPGRRRSAARVSGASLPAAPAPSPSANKPAAAPGASAVGPTPPARLAESALAKSPPEAVRSAPAPAAPAPVRDDASAAPSKPRNRRYFKPRTSELSPRGFARIMATLRRWRRSSRARGLNGEQRPLNVLLLSSLRVSSKRKEQALLHERIDWLRRDVEAQRAAGELADLDLVVVAGDVVAEGAEAQLEAAWPLLRDLPRALSPAASPPPLVVVPGNHDMGRGMAKWRHPIEGGAELDHTMNMRSNQALAMQGGRGFRSLVRRLYDEGVIPSAPAFEPYLLLQHDLEHGGRRVAIRGFDSAWGLPWVGPQTGVLGLQQLEAGLAGLEDADYRIAVVHHPPDAMDPDEWAVLRRSFDLVLTGPGSSPVPVQRTPDRALLVTGPGLIGSDAASRPAGYATLQLGASARVQLRWRDPSRDPVCVECPPRPAD